MLELVSREDKVLKLLELLMSLLVSISFYLLLPCTMAESGIVKMLIWFAITSSKIGITLPV